MREGTDTTDEIHQYDWKMQAFRNLDAARSEIRQYLPDGFDPDKELEEARREMDTEEIG